MGITEKVVKTTRKVKRWTCDICGASSTSNRGCCGHSPFMNCQICGRLTCETHYHLDYDGIGDYPQGIYCITCWEAGQPFRDRKIELDEQFEKDIDEQDSLWKAAALKAVEAEKMGKE